MSSRAIHAASARTGPDCAAATAWAGRDTVPLERHQGYTVPKGVPHRIQSPEPSVVLVVEALGIGPTGD